MLSGLPQGFQDLIDVIVIEALVKKTVEVVEKVNDLVCRAVGGNVGEANDVAEKYGCVIEHLLMIYQLSPLRF